MKRILSLSALFALGCTALLIAAQDPMVGGSPMSSRKNIIQNALNSNDHTTLVAAVKAAGLVDTLEGPGPYTVFAPTNEAFAKLPAGTVDTLLKPENKQMLTSILTYHVLAGKFDTNKLKKEINAGGGTAMLKTLNGESITASMDGDTIVLKDAKGDMAHITIPNVYQSNGVIQVIDTVLQP
ncbi:MAG: fasciclin domain-containing protein [Bryobacteraceae bacterium]